jgi:hypothetical protein
MVAVDDDKIVGYAVWEIPVPSADEAENKGTILPPLAQEGMDKAPFMELRRILEEDVREQFGDKGTVDVWSEFFLYLPTHFTF